MKTGALLFAFDGEICYTKFAVECAKKIKQHLNIPVTLVTDSVQTFPGFNNQILVQKQESSNSRWWADTEKSTSWLNHSRSKSLELSPYDRTLVLDVDYIVSSNNLQVLLDSKQNFFAHKLVQSIHLPEIRSQSFGTKNTDMWWATVLVFDRSEFTQQVFEIWKMVESNYSYYANFFGFDGNQFRNDYALSIALLVANGGLTPEHCNIPWPLLNVDTEVVVKKEEHTTKILYAKSENNQQKYCRIEPNNQDLHIMGKSYLEQVYAL